MRCVPEQRNAGGVKRIVAALLIVGGIFYAMPIAAGAAGVKVWTWPFTGLAVFAVVAAVYLMVRYLLTGFQYVIRTKRETDDGPMVTAYAGGAELNVGDLLPEDLDFAVFKTQNLREPVMECLLGLEALEAVYGLRRSKKDGLTKAGLRERMPGAAVYDYTLTLGIDDAAALVFDDGGKKILLVIEADERMRAYFQTLKPTQD